MKIALLGWGSLVWGSRKLNLPETSWHNDGPMLPIEFARKSRNGRLTLVIYPKAKLVPVLWAEMHQKELSEAIEALQRRECTNTDKVGYIHCGTCHTQFPMILDTLRKWLTRHPHNVLLWTDLESNFDDYNETTVMKYLRSVNNKDACREYINKAPKQIDTDMRRIIVESGFLKPSDNNKLNC